MDPLLLGAGGLVGFAVAAAALSAYLSIARRGEVLRQRIDRAIGGAVSVAGMAEQAPSSSFWAKVLGPFARFSKPGEQTEDFSRIKASLSHAGIRNPRAIEVYYGAKLALASLLSGSVLALNALKTTPISNLHVWAVLLAAAGFYGPSIWLRGRIAARQLALSKSLPDTLDLLVTCVEAGLGLEAALLRITQEIGLSSPELARELRHTVAEIQAGMRRADAFRRLAERTGLDELKSLSAMLIQTEMFGTSIAQALRVHAESMRVRRTHRAEEKGATVSVKMLIPMVLFILPALFAVILGPAVARIATTLLPTLGGK
jgi:tight adherence protein C